jgi:hypothetical protein
MQVIYTVDALCGAGKTYSAIDFALHAAAHGRKIAIIQLSKELIRQSYNHTVLRNTKSLRIRRIDSDEFCYRTKAAIVQHLKDSEEGVGEILFITHAALLGLPYWHHRDRWELIIDEIPQVVEDLSRNIPAAHALVTNALSLRPFNAAYSVVEVVEKATIESYAANQKHDEVYQVLQTISRHLLDTHRTVYANTANWHKVCASKTDDRDHKLCLYSVLAPQAFDGFASVTVMGAMFKHSLLYLLWSGDPNVEFRHHTRIMRQLRYTQHTQGNLITVEFLMDYDWSKRFRDHVLSDGKTVLDHVVAEAQLSMSERRFIYVVNKDVDKALAEKFSSGYKVSSACHGLNNYQDIDSVVFLSALNPAPGHFTFLESQGVNGDELRRAHYLISLYQAVMRISIRDPANIQPKHVVVMDKNAADYLSDVFSGCKVVRNANMPKLPAVPQGRHKIWKDDAARHRARLEKARHLEALTALQTGLSAYAVSIVPSIYTRDVLHSGVRANEILIKELREALNTEIAVKEQNILVSPARFSPTKASETRRGLANIESIYGVWLDNDGGGISHQEFRAIFPALRMACFPTFTGGDRYRVFIPTTQPMTVEVDKNIKRMLIAALHRHGFTDKVAGEGQRPHGFDMSKITPSSLFYIPCRRPGQVTWFADYAGDELDPAK